MWELQPKGGRGGGESKGQKLQHRLEGVDEGKGQLQACVSE